MHMWEKRCRHSHYMPTHAETLTPEDPILSKARMQRDHTIEQTSALRQAYEDGFPNSAPTAEPRKELAALRHLTKAAGFKLRTA